MDNPPRYIDPACYSIEVRSVSKFSSSEHRLCAEKNVKLTRMPVSLQTEHEKLFAQRSIDWKLSISRVADGATLVDGRRVPNQLSRTQVGHSVPTRTV